MYWERAIPLSTLVILIAFTTSSICTDPTQYCENYLICLQRLEAKQRECAKFPEVDLLNGKESASSNQTDCSRKKRREVHRDMAQLHLRRTEIVRDCVAKNVNRGESVLNSNKEKKCLSTAEKLSSFAEILQKQVTKSPRRIKNKSTAGPDSRSAKGHSKRKETTKQNSKVCRRTKKQLNRKCNQLAKCCSIAKECNLLADTIDEQISSLKTELKSPTCHSK